MTFLGGPAGDFERVGRAGLEVLLREGLVPSSRVLDVGCGALRLGYWLMRLLDPGCYYGVEPAQEMLALGLEQFVGADVSDRAQAHFISTDDFDFTAFGARFDFVVARSIWTHASKSQIRSMLGSFAETSLPSGVFLASYQPASACLRVGQRWPCAERIVTGLPMASLSPTLARLPPVGIRLLGNTELQGRLLAEEYEGDAWVGRSHESDRRGLVRHSLRWIAQEASRHGLSAALTSHPVVNHQYWLRITHV
jgi:SAM-dependent methyltransferase